MQVTMAQNLIAIRIGQVRVWLTSSFLGQADQENHFLDDFLQEIYPVCLSFSVACFFSCRQFQTLLSVWSSCVSLFHPKTVFLSMFEKRNTRHRRNHITEKTYGRKDEANRCVVLACLGLWRHKQSSRITDEVPEWAILCFGTVVWKSFTVECGTVGCKSFTVQHISGMERNWIGAEQNGKGKNNLVKYDCSWSSMVSLMKSWCGQCGQPPDTDSFFPLHHDA